MIRVLDFEATGLDEGALVCEVGICDLDPRTLEISAPRGWLCRVDAMPPETRAVHHIRAEDTRGFPPYDRRVLFEDAVRDGVTCWAAQSCAFEEHFIVGHIPMVCTHKAALRVWPEAPGQSVFALLYWLEDQGLVTYDRALAHPPHRAVPDAYATAVLLRAMLQRGVTGAQLFQWTREPRVLPTCPLGQYRGKPWPQVDFGFLEWILNKVDDPDIRWNAARELDRRAAPEGDGSE